MLPDRSASQPRKTPQAKAVSPWARSRCSSPNSSAGPKIAAALPLGRISPCSAPRKSSSSTTAGTAQSAKNCTNSSAPPLGSRVAASSAPARRTSSPPHRLAVLATPKNTGRQNAGLHGAGTVMRRSSVCRRVPRSIHSSGTRAAPTAMTICSRPRPTSLTPMGLARLAPGCTTPTSALMPAYSRLRANKYRIAAMAHHPAAPRTPLVLDMVETSYIYIYFLYHTRSAEKRQ